MVTAQYFDLGMTDYHATLGLQQRIAERMEYASPDEFPDTILLTEHHPCILFGGKEELNRFSREFLASLNGRQPEDALREMGISFYQFRFGGGTSYVGPGQLIVYPINRFERLVPRTAEKIDMEQYKRIVDRTMLAVMRSFGIENAYIAEGFSEKMQRDRRDVWIDINGQSHKIAAKGVHMATRIAYHGFQLYVNREGLRHFDLICPCGYERDQVWVVSMEDVLGRPVDAEGVKERVLTAIKENFRYDDIVKGDISTISTLLSAAAPDPQDTLSDRS